MHPKWGANKDFKRVDSDKYRGPHGGSERSNIRNRGRSDFRGIDLDGYGEIYKKCRKPDLSRGEGTRSKNKLNNSPSVKRDIHRSRRASLENRGVAHNVRRSSDSYSGANDNFKKVDLNNYGEIYKKCKQHDVREGDGMRSKSSAEVDKDLKKVDKKSIENNRSDPSWNNFFNS